VLRCHNNIISTQCLNHHNVSQCRYNIVWTQCLSHCIVLQCHYNFESTQCLNHCNVLQRHYNIISTIVQHQISYQKIDCQMYTNASWHLVQMLLLIEFLSLHHHIQDQQQKAQKRIEIEFWHLAKTPWKEMSIEQVSWIFSFHGVVA
jgi:hypothetical protein